MSRKGVPNKNPYTRKPKSPESQQKEAVLNAFVDLFGADEIIDLDDIQITQPPVDLSTADLSSQDIVTLSDGQRIPRSLSSVFVDSRNADKVENMSEDKQYGCLNAEIKPVTIDPEIGKFAKYLWLQQGQTLGDVEQDFNQKFEHFLMRENLDISGLTYRKIMKFFKFYGNFPIEQVRIDLASRI
jgi:hypothetical protein